MEKQDKYRIFSKAGKFILVLLVLDLVIGTISSRLFFDQKSGKYYRLSKTIYTDTSEILIMGSSHATRHFIPEVFENKLGRTCYNAGVQGQKMLFIQALEEIVYTRHKPEVVVLNVDVDWLFEFDPAYDRLSDFHPYYWEHREILKPRLSLRSNFTDLKLSLKTYQNNSTIAHIMKYMLSHQKDFNGFKPLYDSLPDPGKNADLEKYGKKIDGLEIDTNFVNAYQKFIEVAETNKSELIIVVSPSLVGTDYSKNKSLRMLKSIAEENDLPFLDYSNDQDFLLHFELYNDADHMNEHGAQMFSEKLCDSISKILN